MVIQTVLIACGLCCLLLILASCVLFLLGWLLRIIRPRRRRGHHNPAPDEVGDVIEGEYREIDTNKGV